MQFHFHVPLRSDSAYRLDHACCRPTIWVKITHAGDKSMKKNTRLSKGPLWGSQIRAARSLLKWTAEDLSRESALGVNTIRRAEAAEHETQLTVANELAVRRAFEAAGIEFIDDNGGGEGLRFRRSRRRK